MHTAQYLAVTALLGWGAVLPAQSERPAWDQAEAEAMVRRVLAVEATGQPWDEIAWRTDPAVVAAHAAKTQKPILVYAYLKTEKGPAAAPC